MKIITTMILFSVALLYQVHAGSVKIRMAEAYNSDKAEISTQLSDVVPLLKKSLSFNSYTLLGSTSVNTPSDDKVSLNGYELLCKGDDKRMQVTVFHNRKSILKSTVIFSGGKPVIIGGFKGSKGKVFFIFTK
jgi:hypothetical protein